MENINWICKAKTVNNNIVWMCHKKIKEHFESTSGVTLLGTTSFYEGPINITLGTANFGPSSDLCKDTTGYYKMAEYNFQPDWKHPSYNTDTFKGLNGKMYCDGPEYTGEWDGLYFCGTGIAPYFLGFCAIDNNGKNFMSAIQDFAKYQEFSGAFSVIIRDKNAPGNYYLFPRVAFDCNPLIPHCRIYNTTIEFQAISRYRMGYPGIMDIFGFESETSFNGQSGGNPPPKGSGGVIYEVFVKPFTRPTFPFIPEAKTSNFSPLASDLQARTILWYDAADPNGDGSNIPDNTPLKKWVDKSPNKLNLVRAPVCPYDDSKLNLDMNDGEYTANRGDFDAQGNIVHKWKNRLPRLKASFKNGLSVIRFNGNNGFTRPYGSGPCADANWNKFYPSGVGQIKDQGSLKGHSIFIVSFQTEYGPNDSCIFGLGDCRIGSSQHVPAIIGFGRSSLTGDAASYMVDNYNILNKWVITSVIKFKSSNKPSHKIFANGTQVNQNWNIGNHANYDPTTRPDLWDFSYIRRWDDGLSIGCAGANPNAYQGFSGDIAEVICFPEELNDADRVRVETYLAEKWNLKSAMNIPLPGTLGAALGAGAGSGAGAGPSSEPTNAVQLFPTTNFANKEATISSFCIGYVPSRNERPFQMAYSPDGLTNWQVSPSSDKFGNQFMGCAYNGSMWIACTQNNPSKCGMLSSTDGINWNPISSNGLAYSLPKEYNAFGICYGNGLWVVRATGGTYVSKDGISFSRGRREYNFNCVVYLNGIFLAGDNAQILMSTDGKKFTPVGVLEGQHRSYSSTIDIVFFNNMYIAGYVFTGNQGADNIIYTSTDMKTWSIQSSATKLLDIQTYGNGVYSFCTNGKVVVAGLANINKHAIIYSTDGINWQKTNSDSFGCTYCGSITWTGKYFVAHMFLQQAFRQDENFKTVYSADGITWNNSPDALAFNPSGFIFSASQNMKPYGSGKVNNTFGVGKYSGSKLQSISPKSLQSIKVPSGMQALLYQNGDFTGLGVSITADTPDLSTIADRKNNGFKWNNQMQSMIVQTHTPLPKNLSGTIPKLMLISPDPNSFLSIVAGAKLTRIDGDDYLFVDPNNPDNTFWYNAADLYVSA